MRRNNQKIFVGIDGGISGAIVGLQDGKILFKEVMPIMPSDNGRNTYDIGKIADIFEKYPDSLVILEKAHPTPIMGKSAMFLWGSLWGIMNTILIMSKTPYHVVAAKSWQASLFRDMGGSDTKVKAKLVAERLYPGEDLTHNGKYNSGIIDALLLAHYGERNF